MGGYSQIRSGDYWVTKINSAGSIQWEKSIGGNDLDELKSIQLTTDGGYIIGGSSFSNISGDKTENKRGFEDFWIVKLGSSGNIQWQKTIGGINHDYLYSIEQSPDGGYITGGFSSSNISGDKTENSKGFEDYWLVKLDASGNILWQKTIGGNGDDELRSLQITADGGFILAGSSLSDISGDKTENSWGASDYWILKYSKDDTGIEDANPHFLLQVYPNPVTSYLTISLRNLKKYTLNIINPEGKICFQTTSFATRLQLDVQNLSAGIYFIVARDENRNFIVKKFIKIEN